MSTLTWSLWAPGTSSVTLSESMWRLRRNWFVVITEIGKASVLLAGNSSASTGLDTGVISTVMQSLKGLHYSQKSLLGMRFHSNNPFRRKMSKIRWASLQKEISATAVLWTKLSQWWTSKLLQEKKLKTTNNSAMDLSLKTHWTTASYNLLSTPIQITSKDS